MPIRKRTSKKAKNGIVYEVYFIYKENGITKRYSKSGFATKKEAKEHETLMQAEVNKKGKIVKVIHITFTQLYNEFMECGIDEYQYNTVISTKNMYNTFLKKDIGNILIEEFDYQFFQRYFNSLRNQGISTNRNIRKAINRVLNYAIKMGYINNNPLNLVTVKGIDTGRDNSKILSSKDFSILVNSLKTKESFKWKAYATAIAIGYYTGLRISEVFALEKSDIDFIGGYIDVNKKLNYKGLKKEAFYSSHVMKSKKSKAIIPLAEPLKEILLEWYQINPYEKVICDINGMFVNPNTFSQDVKKIAKEHDIDFHFHMLRHTFATTLVTSNVDLKTAQELMRHTNIDTTMSIYTHINNEHKKHVINDIFRKDCVENVSKTN